MFNLIKDNYLFFLLIFLAIAAPQFFVGAMQVLFYIILGIIVLVLILGMLFRAKIRNLQKEAERAQGNTQGFGGGFHTYSNQQSRTRTHSDEGEVNIFTQKGATDKKISNDVGDYVEFEEVKEKK